MSKPVLAVLKALANDTRYQMVCLLSVRDLCVCEMEIELDQAQSKVSYHLAILKEAGLVQSYQKGKNTFYTLEKTSLYQLGGNILSDILAKQHDITLTHQTELMC